MNWIEEAEAKKTARRKASAKQTAERIAKARANAVDVSPTLYRADPRSNNVEYGPVHIVVKMGGGIRISKCGKAMNWPNSVDRSTEESEECRRCGTHEEFLAVTEGERQRREQESIARKQKEAQEQAEREKRYQEESDALDELMTEVRSIAHLPPKKGRANYRQALQFIFNGRSYVITQGELDKE